MGDMGDSFNAIREAARIDRRRRAEQSLDVYHQAKREAEEAEMTLWRHSDHHYQLSAEESVGCGGPGFLIDIWPSTQCVQHNKSRPRGPRLKGLKRPWTVLDVVRAAIKGTSHAD